MPALVDTTVRLVSQEPLSGRLPTSVILALAEILDGAGFASLEVSGGGVFESAVRRGVESPWERIRAIKARTRTPLGMALRGRFLVGSRPVPREFDGGLVYSPGPTGETDALVEQARRLPELGAARVLLHDPSNSLAPHRAQELVTAIGEATGLPVGIYCQGAGGQ